jgi:hypothetical protein
MVLSEIEQQYIQPLSKAEKEQLILDIQRMLVDEEIAQHGEQMLREMMPPGTVVSIDSPGLYADNTDVEAAVHLQQFIKDHEHEVQV